MRIKLVLRPVKDKCRIPINYQHPISSLIYKILADSSPEYADWLHSHGYITPNNKLMKLFTFSFLQIPYKNRKQDRDSLLIYDAPPCILYISSPMLEDFTTNFIEGLFLNREICIANHYTKENFIIESVEGLPNLTFPCQNDVCYKFKCLSPIMVSIPKGRQNTSEYLIPGDPRLPELIQNNLKNKLVTICPEQLETLTKQGCKASIKFSLDEHYIKNKGGYNKVTKLITIHEGHTEKQTKIRGFLCPFYLLGNPLLLHCAYECGLGEKNSMGFGMIEFLEEIYVDERIER